jgi:assimilatory nitrate reductase catalytic subunit
VAEAEIVQAAKWFGESRATLSLYCQGLNQSSSLPMSTPQPTPQ